MNGRIRELRRERGLTQAALAQRLGISPSAVGMYEQGRREPDHEVLRKMAAVFGCSIDYLVGRTDGQEVGQMIDRFAQVLQDCDGLLFHGKPVSDGDREKIANAIRVAAAVAAPKEEP